MSEIGLNPFYNGEPLESGEPVEGVEISYKYKYDYSYNHIDLFFILLKAYKF